jgi:hypothetical protein
MKSYFSDFISMLRRVFGGEELKATPGPVAGPVKSLDQRRYKRASLLIDAQSTLHSELASAFATFRDKSVPVVDLSHIGVAIRREEIQDQDLRNVSNLEPLILSLGSHPSFTTQARLIRYSDQIIAFEIVTVSNEGRKSIDKFLDPKMVGLNMRSIDRSFFSPEETFSKWYCGPRDTNFYLWISGSRIERAIIQLGDETFALSNVNESEVRFVRQARYGAKLESGSESEDLRNSVFFALDVALQIKEGGDSIRGLVKLLTEAAGSLPKES